jgi:hypothetical protein
MPNAALESALLPATTGAPVTTPTTEIPASSVVTPPAPASGQLYDAKALMAHVEAARTEEKTKLYAKVQELQKDLTETRDQLKARMNPDEQVQAQISELNKRIGEEAAKAQALQVELDTIKRQTAERERQLALQAYQDRRVKEEQAKGRKLLLELVGGDGEQLIDASIDVAAAEYSRLRDNFYAEFQSERPAVPLPAPSAPVGVTVTSVSPSAFPTVPNAATPAQQLAGGVGDFVAEVAELTTPEAIRNGSYARNRDRLLAGVRQGKAVPDAGTQFANRPREYMPQESHGQVVQPQGTQTSAPAPAQLQVVPSNPLPIPGQPPAQGQPVPPPSQGFDPGAARAQAEASARSFLANPARASAFVPAGKSLAGAIPVPTADFGGGNPMIRNS